MNHILQLITSNMLFHDFSALKINISIVSLFMTRENSVIDEQTEKTNKFYTK